VNDAVARDNMGLPARRSPTALKSDPPPTDTTSMIYETCPRCSEPISVLGHPVGVRVLTCDGCGARWAAHPRGKLQRLDDVRVDDIERMDE